MRLEREKAMQIANAFYEYLKDICTDLEIVGSLKRGEPTVGDIELLMILDPSLRPPRPVFGQKKIFKTQLDERLTSSAAPYLLQEAIHKADGDRQKRRAIVEYSKPADDFCIEFFIVTEETWGIQNVIRTGPRGFSKRFVTNKREGGLLPNHLQYVQALTRIMDMNNGGNYLDLRTEQAAIGILSRGWIEPADRWKLINSDTL